MWLNGLQSTLNLLALACARRPPKRLDSGCSAHIFQTPEDYYRKVYFEVIDVLVPELQRRFSQDTVGIANEIEVTLLKAANCKDTNSAIGCEETLLEFYKKDIDGKKLVRQLIMLPDLVAEVRKTSPAFSSLNSFTNAWTLVDIMNTSQLTFGMFSELAKFLKIFLTIPVTTATAERSFSALRRLKTYLRSTMTQEKLNNVMLLHCHKQKTDIDLELIVKEFISANDRRKHFFSVF